MHALIINGAMVDKEFSVTPWEVKGEVDYDKLVNQFGTKRIDKNLVDRLKKHTKDLHYLLRREIFFSHRDFDWILDRYERGEKFFIYTGRGPSGHTHLGHLVPWIFCRWLQKEFGAELYFQMTDDEKFLVKNLSLKETTGFAYDNMLDVIALGFDPKKTFIFTDTEYAKTLYKLAVQISKHVTLSTAKAVFGFTNESNIGITFFPAMQAAPCFLPSVLKGKNIPCIIPAAIDQDPYWRISRDVAPKMNFYKPAQIHSKFFPSLQRGEKMSASDPRTAVFTTDSLEVAREKIMNAFTGQRATAEEQKKYGGNPEICSVCQYYYFMFEEDDKKVKKIFDAERSGELLAGEHKEDLAGRVMKFLEKHQEKREKAKDRIDDFIVKD